MRALVLVLSVATSGCLVEIRQLADPHTGGSDNDTVGAAGSGGALGVGGHGGQSAPCPPEMVHASDGGEISFCIDRTEVTQAMYVQFLAGVQGSVPVDEQPPVCSGNTELTHTPDAACPDFTTASDLPVWCVDWCDAHAYCKWAGKRMCGAIAGGPLGFDDAPLLGEWHFACTGGLMTTYPYGDAPDDAACNITETNTKLPAGSHPACEGGFPGMFDMQGNVEEWIDACQPAGPTAECRARGGHTFGSATYWRCDKQIGVAQLDPNSRVTGFRCCKEADR